VNEDSTGVKQNFPGFGGRSRSHPERPDPGSTADALKAQPSRRTG
jgi:hypothetical protein